MNNEIGSHPTGSPQEARKHASTKVVVRKRGQHQQLPEPLTNTKFCKTEAVQNI